MLKIVNPVRISLGTFVPELTLSCAPLHGLLAAQAELLLNVTK